MKLLLSSTIFISFLWIFNTNLLSQNCRDYEKKCPSPPKGFKISALSKSFSLQKMKIVHVKLTLYGDKAYFFSVSGKAKLGKLHYRLLEDSSTRNVLYDNAADEFQDSRIFEIASTINVILEVSAPNFYTEKRRECAGLLVGYSPIKN